MKTKIILLQIMFFAFLPGLIWSQTYIINASGSGDCGRSGIDGPYNCVSDGDPPKVLGSFTDTNVPESELASLSLVIYNACNGNFEVFLNGVSIATDTTAGTGCNCEAITANSSVTNNVQVTLNQNIIDAYQMGGSNELSVTVSNSAFGVQCFYGAELTINTNTLNTNEEVITTPKLYPNPVQNKLYTTGVKPQSAYKIYSLEGKCLLNGILSNNQQIDMQVLPPGYYLLVFDGMRAVFVIKE
jgi:hypothetical protein